MACGDQGTSRRREGAVHLPNDGRGGGSPLTSCGGCAPPDTRRTSPAAACATGCSVASRSTTTSPPARRPRRCRRSSAAPSRWACSSASSSSSSTARASRWRRSAPTTRTSTAGGRAPCTSARARGRCLPARLHRSTRCFEDPLTRRDPRLRRRGRRPARRRRSAPSATRRRASRRIGSACCARSASPRASASGSTRRRARRSSPRRPTLPDIAAERIGDEIVKILTEGGARRGFELLDDTGLLRRGAAGGRAHAAAWRSRPIIIPRATSGRTRSCCSTSSPAGVPETLALGALLHDVAKPLCAGPEGRPHHVLRSPRPSARTWPSPICQRLRRSRATWERVDYLVRHHLRLVQAPEMRLATLKKMLGGGRLRRAAAASRGSTPSRRTATSASSSSASAARRSWARRPCGHRGCSAGPTCWRSATRAGPRSARSCAPSRMRSSKASVRHAGRRRGLRARRASRWSRDDVSGRDADRRYSTSSRTPYPVAPRGESGSSFSANAGPAMSRWAHGTPSTNSPRKSAADDGAGVTAADVLQIGDAALQVLAVLAARAGAARAPRRWRGRRRAARSTSA